VFTRHEFLLVTVKEWLKSVLIYRSYPKNKTGYPFFGPPCIVPTLQSWQQCHFPIENIMMHDILSFVVLTVKHSGKRYGPRDSCELSVV